MDPFTKYLTIVVMVSIECPEKSEITIKDPLIVEKCNKNLS